MARRLAVVIGGLICLAFLGADVEAQTCNQVSPPTLCIDPISWNIIGLDSNKAVPPNNDGPDTFMVGARACNKGASTITNVTATYNVQPTDWDPNPPVSLGINPYINLADNSTITVDEIRPGRCEDFYFNGQITRVNAAYFTKQRFTVTATSGVLSAVTPSPRELYIEKLNSQNRNEVGGIFGPTSLQVGGIYSFQVTWSTAPGGYEQLEHFVNLTNVSFRLLNSYSAYDTGGVNTTIYADGCGWDNDPTSGTYRSCLGVGKNGGNVTTHFTVQILSATPPAGSLLRALIYDFSGSSYHYNTDFNTDSGLTIVANAASDLAVTISDSPDPVVAGGTITYTGTVTNNGLSPVTTTDGGALKIPIPPGTTFSSVSMPGWTCGLASGVVTCTPNATFADGASANYTLAVTVNGGTASGSVIQATATISSNFEDSVPSNNSASTTTLVLTNTQTDLVATSSAPAVVVQGTPFNYTHTVTNSGPAAAITPVVLISVPAGSTFNSVTTPSTGWTCSAPVSGTITCTRNTSLAVGEVTNFTLNVTPTGAIASSLSSTLTAATGTEEPVTTNNISTATTNIIAASTADVGITVSDFPDPVVPGESILYTQTVTNNGVIPATGVTVTFPTPPNTTYTYIDEPVGWDCSTYPLPGTPTAGSAGTVTCTKATMAVGETASFPLTVSVNSTTPVGTIINYTATVSTTSPDSIAANNTASVSTLVASASTADVQIVKTASADPVRTGTSLVYTLVVTNNGPAAAANVNVSDPLPTNLTYVSATTSRGSCSYNAGTRTVSCALGTLANSQTATIYIATTVDPAAAGSTLNNTATVTTTTTDPVPSNNSSSKSVVVVAATAATMLRAEAVHNGGTVDVRWVTSAERSNLGFNIYRETGTARTRVNQTLVAGSMLITGADPRAGFSYRWTDRRPATGAVYWIESVDFAGNRKLHGPVVPAGAASAARAAAAITAEGAAESLTIADLRRPSKAQASWQHSIDDIERETVESMFEDEAAAPEVVMARQFELASRPGAKILVSAEGYYRVTRSQLAAAGFDPGSDPRSLSLYVDAQEIPIAVADGGDNRFDASDYIEFYAVGMDTTYSGSRAYWLVNGNNGLRFKPKSKVKGAPLGVASFPHTIERKERFIYFGAQYNAPDRDSFYGSVVYSDPTVQPLEVSNPAAGGTATLTVALQGATMVNHHIAVSLNGTHLGYVDYYGQQNGTATFQVPASSLRAGTNEVTLMGTDGWSSISFVDYVRLTYPHLYAADANRLRFPATGGREVTVSGFTASDIRVLDVTNPLDPQEVESQVVTSNGASSLVVIPHTTGSRVLYATSMAAAAPPAAIVPNTASSLNARSNSADLVIITHSRFRSTVTPLADRRSAQGIETIVVDVEDVFDEYGFGAKSPDAIRDFFASTRSRWRKAPKWAMLVGDASFDPRNYAGYGDLDLVPTRILPTKYMKAASDNWIADVDGDGAADVHLGRLSVRTVEEAQSVVDKLLAWTPVAAPTVLMVVDQNDPTFSFSDASVVVRNAVPAGYSLQTFNITSAGDRTALHSRLRSGYSVVNYIGHGSVDGWSNTSVLGSWDAPSLTGYAPLYLMMNCLNGMFADVWTTSLAESLLRTPNGGAVGVFASSGMSDPQPQVVMNEALYRILAANPTISIGELLDRAKAAAQDEEVRITWSLFGDPTLKLKQ